MHYQFLLLNFQGNSHQLYIHQLTNNYSKKPKKSLTKAEMSFYSKYCRKLFEFINFHYKVHIDKRLWYQMAHTWFSTSVKYSFIDYSFLPQSSDLLTLDNHLHLIEPLKIPLQLEMALKETAKENNQKPQELFGEILKDAINDHQSDWNLTDYNYNNNNDFDYDDNDQVFSCFLDNSLYNPSSVSFIFVNCEYLFTNISFYKLGTIITI
jgi:hypothetical protein